MSPVDRRILFWIAAIFIPLGIWLWVKAPDDPHTMEAIIAMAVGFVIVFFFSLGSKKK